MVHVYILDLDISNSEFNSGEFGIGDGLLKPPLLIASQKPGHLHLGEHFGLLHLTQIST